MKCKNSPLIILLIIMLTCAVLTTSGCSSKDENGTGDAVSGMEVTSGSDNASQPEGGSDNTLVLGEMWDIESIDPINGDGTLICEKAAITETLVGANEDFSLKPELATSWEQLDENTWEFKLRNNVTFHDGSKMTAKEVKFTLEKVISENSKVASMLKMDSIEVVDDYTLKIKTKEINPILPGVLHYPDTAIISPSSYNEKGELVKPVGTGPYKFGSFDEQTRILTVVKNENWWGGKVGLDKLILKGIPDPNTRAMAIENGEVDFTVDVPYSETDRIDAIDGINVEKYKTPRVYKLDLNLKHEPLEDVKVRQAISYAINRSDIAENVLYNVGEAAAGPFLPTMVWANKSLKPYSQDLKKADELLTAAGWVDTDGDGIRDKNGKPLKLNLMTYAARPGLPPMAEAMAAQLREAGIGIETEVMEMGSIDDRREKGNWDLYLAAYNIAMVPDPEYILTNWYMTNGTDNTPGYSNPKVDSLITEARKITDPNERYKKFNEVEAIVYDEQPMIIVAYYGCAIVKKDYVKGYVFDPTAHDYRINAGMYLENKS
ncbi:ABC transporter substrate-binding protein [Methanosarcina sp.]|uniref:ABC transporter substrate-binding protein n=1 Tax=Methanosarcina sp. TaxID=2213 RepID=UPI0029897048|nr:ABC transporter substrate-binding protein [Methanosarcina sp.]MDW5551056.1 ABC transporter substrate-binding protein [Methanosarcina sp.]MDW5554986.1 ABC transporter substrate-binding protein [Methanosarcina sp.]MDW5558386.1 ABC transporter substrate-binding protein [Methanosarcina sp.]